MMDADGHTTVSLRVYIERILEERERTLEARLLGEREALRLAREELRGELFKLNELRQEVTADRSLLIDRKEYQAAMEELKRWQDRADGALNVARFLGLSGLLALGLEIIRMANLVKLGLEIVRLASLIKP